MQPRSKVDPGYLDERLATIRRGIASAIEREVRRLEEMGFPMHVGKDGQVITIEPKATRGNGASQASPNNGGNGAGRQSS